MKPIYHSYSAWRRALSCLPQAGCVLALAVLSAGCTQNDLGEGLTGGGSKPGSFVTLSLTTPSAPAMRSNPTGGEQGDGLETGQDYENEVKSAVAFFYQGSGVNAEGTTRIQAAVPFTFTSHTAGSNGVDRVYTTTPQTVDLDNGTYHLLLVANPGTEWWLGKSLTLGDVRDHIQQQAWKQAADGGYSDFVMTSAADATVTLNFNPENDPAKATVDVERMAARLDYQADGRYTCQDPQYSNATVEITGAALVNNLTAGSYVTKRVATDVNGTGLSYLGDETPDAGVQTNYVLDPWTAQKTADYNSFTIGDATAQPASALYGVWFDDSWADPNQWANYVKAGTSVSAGSETWQRIGYTLENTTAAAEAGSRYSTGVVFKAKFHPQGVLNYTDGATFFSYGGNLYASMEDMMQHFYGSVFTKDFSKVTSCTTWGEVKKFITSTLLTNDPSGYYTWLKNQADSKANDEAVAVADAQSLTWSRYMLTECGYSKSADGAVTLDQNGKVTRTALRPTGVRTYEDATCYYTWWVRHSNDGLDDTNGVMEYAIVRNNIYKLKVNSIYSLGGDIPTDEDNNLVIEVYVKDWQLLPEEELPM